MVPVEWLSLPASASILVESSLALLCFSLIYPQQGLNNSALTLRIWSCGLFPSMANKISYNLTQTPASSPIRNHACDSAFLRCQHIQAYTSFCSLCSEFLLQSRIFHLFLLSVKACLKCIWESFILLPLSFSMRINSSFNFALQAHCI